MAPIRDAISTDTDKPFISDTSASSVELQNTSTVLNLKASGALELQRQIDPVPAPPTKPDALFSHAPPGFYADIKATPIFRSPEKLGTNSLVTARAYSRREVPIRIEPSDFVSKIAGDLERRLGYLDERIEMQVVHREFGRPWSYDGRTWHNISV